MHTQKGTGRQRKRHRDRHKDRNKLADRQTPVTVFNGPTPHQFSNPFSFNFSTSRPFLQIIDDLDISAMAHTAVGRITVVRVRTRP